MNQTVFMVCVIAILIVVRLRATILAPSPPTDGETPPSAISCFIAGWNQVLQALKSPSPIILFTVYLVYEIVKIIHLRKLAVNSGFPIEALSPRFSSFSQVYVRFIISLSVIWPKVLKSGAELFANSFFVAFLLSYKMPSKSELLRVGLAAGLQRIWRHIGDFLFVTACGLIVLLLIEFIYYIVKVNTVNVFPSHMLLILLSQVLLMVAAIWVLGIYTAWFGYPVHTQKL